MSDSTGTTEAGNTDAFERPRRLETYFNKKKRGKRRESLEWWRCWGGGVRIRSLGTQNCESFWKVLTRLQLQIYNFLMHRKPLGNLCPRAIQTTTSSEKLTCQLLFHGTAKVISKWAGVEEDLSGPEIIQDKLICHATLRLLHRETEAHRWAKLELNTIRHTNDRSQKFQKSNLKVNVFTINGK